ncbi:uncharacterized protein J8A68_001150 [[Candida] subhashii]|uniref:Exonuclease domain-containing protein n=1 Tax=[Candida] subhashii TaxID=561895 RepID=A0A8J5USW0_9ASCO|nr:uncharacterized protein J8A68_001150 [[Candida] subhashii]KAG7665462.1 hypothetical protein J8A68_001150 [[Candida] subhashii]
MDPNEHDPQDPLSTHTARLSICQADIVEEDSNPRLHVRDLLLREETSHPNHTRRDSAVSLNSFNDDDPTLSPNSKFHVRQEKRRRSSVQSFSTANGHKSKKEKVHKKKLKKLNDPPKIELNLSAIPTDSGGSSIVDGSPKRFPFRNLRFVILHIFKALTGHKPKWIQTTNQEKIPTVCVCLVPGLQIENKTSDDEQQISTSELKQYPELEFLYSTFPNYIKTNSPGSKDTLYSPLQSITNIPLSKNEKRIILEKSKQTKITIYDLLMTPSDLETHGYPLELGPDWIETISYPSSSGPTESHIYALDCEFCKAGDSHVLTRVSLIDFNGTVVFDKFVKPAQEITDYVTKYSGITEEKLRDVTTTLSDIQQLFQSTVYKQDILIGHSLDSDLNVMKIKHDNIVDTAVIFEHVRGPPSKPSLKWLAKTYLERNIQTGETTGEGHSSVEDAKACLDLVKAKILEGKCFGMNVNEISIFQRLAKNHETNRKPGDDYDFKSLWLGYSQYKDQETYVEPEDYHVTHEYVNNDDEMIDKFEELSPGKRFIVMSLREMEYNWKWSTPPQHYNGELNEGIEKEELYGRTNDRLKRVYEALPDHSLMIVCTQSNSPLEMYQLQNVRKNFQKLDREGVDVTKLPKEESWDIEKQNELIDKTTMARESLIFMTLKQPKPTQSNVD